jgi:hypothetical protein
VFAPLLLERGDTREANLVFGKAAQLCRHFHSLLRAATCDGGARALFRLLTILKLILHWIAKLCLHFLHIIILFI